MDNSIERDAYCFCCGTENEKGLHLAFSYPREGEATASLQVPEYFSGWKGVTHGGFLSMLLDEAMAHACLGVAEAAVTGEITVRFLKPLKTGTLVQITGKIVENKGRLLLTEGWIQDASGTKVAEGRAKFLVTKRA